MFNLCSFLFAAAILLTSSFKVQVCEAAPPLSSCATILSGNCQTTNCSSACSYFFDAVENALVTDNSALYSLQRAFFPSGEQKPSVVDIYVTLILERAIDLPCDSELNTLRNERIDSLSNVDINELCDNSTDFSCTRKELRWHHVWSSAVLTNLIERESLGLISSINSLAFVTRLYSESQTSVIITSEQRDFQPREIAFLELIVPSLLCLPNDTETTMRSAWEDILPWIHTYTLQRGRIAFSDGERAFIFQDGNLDPNSEGIVGSFPRREVEENVFVPYLTSLHVLLQVAAGLIIMKLVPTYYESVCKGKKPGAPISIFWANVFFAAIIDILFVCLDLYLIVSVYSGVDDAISAITSNNRSALETVFAFGLLGALVTFVLTILQFVMAVGTPKNTWLYVPGLVKLFFCFFRCPCKKLNGEFWYKVLQTFSLWFIMLFLQLVAGSLIPYLVLAIVNPVPSVTFLALGASTLFCLIIFVASVIQVGAQNKHWNCCEKLIAVVRGLVFIVFLGLVAITVIIYQGVIQSGTNTGVVSGILLSLVPSGIIAVLGLAVKSKLLSDGDEEEEEEGEKQSLFRRASKLLRTRFGTRRDSDARGESNSQATSIEEVDNNTNTLQMKYLDRDENVKASTPSNEVVDDNHKITKSDLGEAARTSREGSMEKSDDQPEDKSPAKEGSEEPEEETGLSNAVTGGSDESGLSALNAEEPKSGEPPSTVDDDDTSGTLHNEMAEVWLKIEFNDGDDDNEEDA